MNTQPFQSRVKRTMLAAGKCLLIAVGAVAAVSAQESQEPIDVKVSVHPLPFSVIAGTGELVFEATIGIVRERGLSIVRANGVILKVEIPDGAVLTVREEDSEKCNFAEGVLTCNLGRVLSGGLHGGIPFYFRVKAAEGSQVIPLKVSVTANEFDPNTENNTFTSTFRTAVKVRKRTRFF